MSTTPRELVASINGSEVGTLRDEANIWSFTYAPEWIGDAHAFDLAPNLPRSKGQILDGASERPVQWFFDNLLPEEQAREVLAREAQIDQADAFGLLAYYGKESAGAITLLTRGEALPESGYRELTDEELHDRISKLPRQSLAAGAPKHMSNAGAQHKLAVCVREGKLYHPVGNTASTHILKPDNVRSDLYPDSVANEYFVMRLAGRLGLAVPSVEIRFVPDPVYLIERFDRKTNGAETTRLHIVDACQLLGLDRTFKYRQAGVDTMIRCVEMCTNRAQSRQGILAWVLFNLLVGNADAHLKNLSFLVRPGTIELAPFYDLLSTESYSAEYGNLPRWPNRELSMAVGNAKTFAEVKRKDFLQFATQLGVNPRASTRLLDEFVGGIEEAAAEVYQGFEAVVMPEPLRRESQLRVLRSVQFAIIRDMVPRLRG